MADERPAFTLEAGQRSASGLPLEAWALAVGGYGVLVGAMMAHMPEACPPSVMCFPGPDPVTPVLALSAALASAALCWFLLPVREEREAVIRAAAVAAIVAGAFTAAASFIVRADFSAFFVWPVVGAAVPAAMLSALRPEAALELGPRKQRRSLLWLRAGAVPALAGAAGLALGWELEIATNLGLPPVFGPFDTWSPPGWSPGALVGGVMFAAAGLSALALATVTPGGDSAEARPPASRAKLLARMTPMLRFDFLAEAALSFSTAVTITAVFLAAWVREDRGSALTALALGAAVGLVCYALFAPTMDFLLGRGRFLSGASLAGALFPLAVGAGLGSAAGLPFFAAGALWAFAASSAPQRFALLFDLASSRGRLRVAADVHGAKLAVAAAGPWAYLEIERVAPGTGLLAASLLCLIAFAFFAPTLGGLGRRQK